MAESKSPFYVVRNFISPKVCEQLIFNLNTTVPDSDKQGNYIKTCLSSEHCSSIVYKRLYDLVPTLEQHYGIQYKGTLDIGFEWFPEGSKGDIICENSQYLRGKWVRLGSNDLTAVLFLTDYQDTHHFDQEYEVYGGKLEFPQHNFGFNPERGTLVVYPSDPHFLNATSFISAGDLFQVRIQIARTQPFIYQPQKFPGNYQTWFAELV